MPSTCSSSGRSGRGLLQAAGVDPDDRIRRSIYRIRNNHRDGDVVDSGNVVCGDDGGLYRGSNGLEFCG